MDDSQDDIPVDPQLIAGPGDTARALALSAGRTSESTPIRRTFVQPLEREEQPNGGPLAALVRRRNHRGLVLYLMIVTLASKEPWNVCRDSKIWARLLSMSTDKAGRAAVSRTIRTLRDLRLVEVERRGRKADIRLLMEDGSGVLYDHPDPDAGDRYLRLPHAFWSDGWFMKLETPGLAMLLILLAEKPTVVLPIDRIPDWYGISRATAQRGFTELEEHGLVSSWVTQRAEPLAPEGYTFSKHHRLLPPFDRPEPAAPESEVPAPAPTASQRRRHRRKTSTTTERRN